MASIFGGSSHTSSVWGGPSSTTINATKYSIGLGNVDNTSDKHSALADSTVFYVDSGVHLTQGTAHNVKTKQVVFDTRQAHVPHFDPLTGELVPQIIGELTVPLGFKMELDNALSTIGIQATHDDKNYFDGKHDLMVMICAQQDGYDVTNNYGYAYAQWPLDSDNHKKKTDLIAVLDWFQLNGFDENGLPISQTVNRTLFPGIYNIYGVLYKQPHDGLAPYGDDTNPPDSFWKTKMADASKTKFEGTDYRTGFNDVLDPSGNRTCVKGYQAYFYPATAGTVSGYDDYLGHFFNGIKIKTKNVEAYTGSASNFYVTGSETAPVQVPTTLTDTRTTDETNYAMVNKYAINSTTPASVSANSYNAEVLNALKSTNTPAIIATLEVKDTSPSLELKDADSFLTFKIKEQKFYKNRKNITKIHGWVMLCAQDISGNSTYDFTNNYGYATFRFSGINTPNSEEFDKDFFTTLEWNSVTGQTANASLAPGFYDVYAVFYEADKQMANRTSANPFADQTGNAKNTLPNHFNTISGVNTNDSNNIHDILGDGYIKHLKGQNFLVADHVTSVTDAKAASGYDVHPSYFNSRIQINLDPVV